MSATSREQAVNSSPGGIRPTHGSYEEARRQRHRPQFSDHFHLLPGQADFLFGFA